MSCRGLSAASGLVPRGGRRCDRDLATWPRPFPTPSFKPASEIRVCCGFCVACCFNECQTWTVRFLVRKVIPMRLLKTLEHRCRVRLVWTIPNSQTEIYVRPKQKAKKFQVSCLPGCQEIRTIICVSVFPGNPAVLQWLPQMVFCKRRVKFNLPPGIPGSQTSKNIKSTRLYPLPNAIPGVSRVSFPWFSMGFPWISMDFNAVQMIPSCKLTWMLNAHNKCRSFLQGNHGFSTSFCMFTRDILWISYGFPMIFTDFVQIPLFFCLGLPRCRGNERPCHPCASSSAPWDEKWNVEGKRSIKRDSKKHILNIFNGLV